MALAIWQKYNAVFNQAALVNCSRCNGFGYTGETYHCNCGASWDVSKGENPCYACRGWTSRTPTKNWCNPCDGTGSVKSGNDYYSQGTYLSAVTAEQNTYPQNGRHTDGFWYVYQGLANKAPTISGSNTNLGTITTLAYKYSVNDTDASDTITVTEKLDNVQLRRFTATRGVEYTVSPTWIEVLNGTHTLTITAADNTGTTATRTITFTKAEHELEFTLATPLAADALVSKTIMSITREIPPGALMQVFVCNNGFDTTPTWEDITSKVASEGKFFFTNTVKTHAKWGFNLKVIVQRLGADGTCYITTVGGNYE